MEAIRWLVGSVLIGVFGFVLIGNIGCVIAMMVNRRRISFVLLVGGLSGTFGLLMLPDTNLHGWCWIPLVVDLAAPYGLAYILAATLHVVYRLRTLRNEER